MIVIIMLVMMLFGPTLSLASDENTHLIATFDDRIYHFGETVNVTIETYYHGERSWGSDPVVHLGGIRSDAKLQRVPEEEGCYNFSFTLMEEDVDEWGHVWVNINMGGPGQRAFEQLGIRTELTDAFQTRVFIPDPFDEIPIPGQEVEFEVRTTWNGVPVDADPGSIEVYAGPRDYYGGQDPRENISVRRESIGMYTGVYTISHNAIYSHEYPIVAKATYTKDGIDFWDRDTKRLFKHFLTAWVHVAEVNASHVHLEIGLVDLDGLPASGAEVNLSIVSPSMMEPYDHPIVSWYEVRTADEHGRVRFVLNISDLETDYLWSYIIGRAEYNGLFQTFEVEISTEDWEGSLYWTHRYDTIELLTDMPLQSGEEVTLEYQVLMNDGVPYYDRVAIYITDGENVYSSGLVSIDDDGHFTVDLVTPQIPNGGLSHHVLSVWFEYRTVAGYWYEEDSHLVVADGMPESYWERQVDGDLTMTIEPTDEPGLFDIYIEGHGLMDDEAKVSILWGLDYPYTSEDYRWAKKYAPFGEAYPDRWIDINAREYAGQYFYRTIIAPCTWENGTYHAQVRLPWYLQDDSEIYFLGIVEPYDTLEPRVVLQNSSMGDLWDWESREPPQVVDGGEEPTDQSVIDWITDSPLWLLIMVVSIAFGLSIVVMMLRRGREDIKGPIG